MALQHRNNRHIRANCFIIRIRCIRVFQWMVKCREKRWDKEVGAVGGVGGVRGGCLIVLERGSPGRKDKIQVGKLGSRVVMGWDICRSSVAFNLGFTQPRRG